MDPELLESFPSSRGRGVDGSRVLGLDHRAYRRSGSGYVTFGFVADALGRKRAYLTYLLVAAVLVPLYGSTRNLVALLMLGPFVAFFGTGYFSGFGTVSAELFPTRIRATAQGLTYNIGRVASAAAPFAVGELAEVYGLGAAFDLTAVAFLFSAALAAFIPETRGKVLELITSAPQRRGTLDRQSSNSRTISSRISWTRYIRSPSNKWRSHGRSAPKNSRVVST